MVFKIFCFLFMQIFGRLFDFIDKYNIISIPDLPPEFYTYFDMGIDYIIEGIGFFMYYFAGEYILGLFGVSLVLLIVENVYYFIMWVIRKLPVPSE